MANPYSGPDDFLDKSQVPYGVGDGQESVRKSLQATNGAAHRAESEARAAKDIATQTRDYITQRFVYQNQGKDGTGTDDLISSVNATNGEVYRIGNQLDRLEAKVDRLIAALPPQTSSTSKEL